MEPAKDTSKNTGRAQQASARASEALQRLKTQLQTIWEKINNIVQTNYELGRMHLSHGNYRDAWLRFQMTLWFDPHFYPAWYDLGCCHLLRLQDKEAAAAFRKTLQLKPDHEEAKFMLATVEGDRLPAKELPSAMPKELAANHFNSQAETYNEQARASGYQAHRILGETLAVLLPPERKDLAILELGCGTGLCGPFLRAHAGTLTGVDIAQSMLDIATKLKDANGRNVYDALILRDLREALEETTPASYDLIAAVKVFNYVGKLDQVIPACAKALRPGGWLTFTTDELEEGENFRFIQAIGRFAHSPPYLRKLAADAGLQEAKSELVEISPGYVMRLSMYRL